MTFEVPKDTSSPVSLMQPDAFFQLALRAMESLHEFQMEWWRALSGLIGQLTPADAVPETMDMPAAEAASPEPARPDAPEVA